MRASLPPHANVSAAPRLFLSKSSATRPISSLRRPSKIDSEERMVSKLSTEPRYSLALPIGTHLAHGYGMASLLRLLVASTVALALAGCSTASKPVTMADSFDLDIFGPHGDDLHTPYVAGAEFQITVSAGSDQAK